MYASDGGRPLGDPAIRIGRVDDGFESQHV
jgi:hypothetical protein